MGPSPTSGITADQLREILELHNRWLATSGRDGAKANLSQQDFTRADLKQVLEQSVRENMPLAQIDFSGSILSDLDLSNANLNQVQMERASLHRANLEGATLTDAALNHSDFSEINGSAADFTNIWGIGLNLSGAKLGAAQFCNAKLIAANLYSASLAWANLAGANLEKSDFGGAQLYWANLANCKFDKVNLHGAQMYWANVTNSDFKEADLSLADMRQVQGLRLDMSIIRNTRFSPVDSRVWSMATYLWRKVPALEAQFPHVENDPWSVLRQTYSSSRVFLHFLLVLLFAAPYFGRVVFWIGKGQLGPGPHAAATLATQSTPQTSPSHAEDQSPKRVFRTWQILLRVDDGIVATALAVLLLGYALVLGVLVANVITLRDEEARSGYSPAWQEYCRLLRMHYFECSVFYIVLGAFLWNLGQFLMYPVAR